VLGHERPSITSAYLGNHVTMDRSHRANIKTLLGKLEASVELRQLVKTEGVDRVWVVGPEASGAPIGSHLMISMQALSEDGIGGEVPPDAGSRIGILIGRIMGKPCLCITYASFRQQDFESLELIGLTHERALIQETACA